jgi:hypothetical protein
MLISELPKDLQDLNLLVRCAGDGLVEFGWTSISWPEDQDFEWEVMEWRWHASNYEQGAPYTQRMMDAARVAPGGCASIRLTAQGEHAACVGPRTMGDPNRRRRSKISLTEANMELARLKRDSPGWEAFTRNRLAEIVALRTGKTCSLSTISNTDLWKQKDRSARGTGIRHLAHASTKGSFEALATEDSLARRIEASAPNSHITIAVYDDANDEIGMESRGESVVAENEAAHVIRNSRLDEIEKNALLDKLLIGQMTPAAAVEAVQLLEGS